MPKQGAESRVGIALQGNFSAKVKNNYDFQVKINTLMPYFQKLFI